MPKIYKFDIIKKILIGDIMYYKILKAFGFAIYSEQDFYITKKDKTHFKVTAKNGLYAIVEIYDNTMFVDVFDKSKKNLAHYCTILADTTLSFDKFVIKNIQESILFKLPPEDIDNFFSTYVKVFKEVRNISFPFFNIAYILYNNKPKELNDDYLYQNTEHNKIHYSHVLFTKKNVIRNITRYSFYTSPLNSFGKHKESHSYLIGDTFFYVCNLDQFFQTKTDSFLTKYSFNIIDLSYGINNQLNEHHQLYINNIDLKKITLLKHNNKNYCFITKNKRIITLSYLSDFSSRYSQLEEDSKYSSDKDVIESSEIPVKFYKNSRMITYTYYHGKITTKSSKFSAIDAAEHEMAISNKVMNQFNYLKLNFPSDKVITRLIDLGLSSETPLNTDDLLILEMSKI